MALVDTLDYFPEQHPGRERLLKYLRSLADAVVAAQDKTYKGWYNIMDPGMETRSGNYIESSASAMFVYALLKSLRLGYISGSQYQDAALSGYDLMTSTFLRENADDGSLVWEWTAQTGSLSSNGTFEVFLHASSILFRMTIANEVQSTTLAFRSSKTISRELHLCCSPRTSLNSTWNQTSEC